MSTNNQLKKKKRLSTEELKKCKGFEEYTQEQAEQAIYTLEALSILYYELYIEQQLKESHHGKIKQ